MNEFPESVFLDSRPSQLRCGDWQSDAAFLDALRASWLSYFAEYTGLEHAGAYLSRLEQEQRLFFHHDPLTIHAWLDDRIVGVAALRPLDKINLVTLLEVHPDFQGRGIGSQLIRALCAASPRIMAHVSIYRARNLRFYQRHGFHLLKRDNVQHGSHQLLFDVLAR